MPSRISINVHGHSVKDKPRLLSFLQQLQPSAVLVLDNLDLAREIKGRLPACNVIFREFERDRQLHKDFTPEQWLNSHAHQTAGGIVLHVMNEQSFDADVLRWLCELMKLAAPRRIPLIVGNWAVGNPQPEAWTAALEFLRLLDQHRDLFLLGLHEYAGGIVTSGLVGGEPTLIQPETWPQDLTGVTCWHMGRFKFLLQVCDQHSIRCPRIILTEHGFDDTSDIKRWLDTLVRALGVGSFWDRLAAWWTRLFANVAVRALTVLNIRGWKTLRKQWAIWFPGWSPERAYFEQLKWADRTIYRNPPVEAQCIFCWGHSSAAWEQFDIADAFELQDLLIKEAQNVPTLPTPEPFPADNHHGWGFGRVEHPSGGRTNVREQPFTTAKTIFQIPPEGHDDAFFNTSAVVKKGDGLWFPIQILLNWPTRPVAIPLEPERKRGWVRQDVIKFTKNAPEEPAPVTHPLIVLEFAPEVAEHDLATLATALGIVLGDQVTAVSVRRE